jgi:MFS family permease
MTTAKTSPPGKKHFYGWIALAGGALTALVGGGIFFYSYGVFLPVMCSYFGWSRAALSTGLSIGLVVFGLLGPVYGNLIDRYGPRINLVIGNVLLAVMLAGMALVKEVWQVYLLYALVGLGAGLGGYVALMTVANNWFKKHRPLAMGISSAATGAGGFIFPPLVTKLIAALQWQTSWLVLAGVVLVFAAGIGAWAMVRNRPEDMGQTPDGLPEEKTAAGDDLPSADTGWTLKKALRQPATWLLIMMSVANQFAMGTMAAHQVAHVQDLGFSADSAALTMSLTALLSITGSLTFGLVALKVSSRRLTIIAFCFQTAGLIVLLLARQLPLIYVYAVLWGFGSGILFSAVPSMLGDYYGRAQYAQITGVASAIAIGSEALAPVVAGLIFDRTASYTTAFIILVVLAVVGLVCASFARPPKPQVS